MYYIQNKPDWEHYTPTPIADIWQHQNPAKWTRIDLTCHNPLRLLTAGKGHPVWAMELRAPSIPMSQMPPSPLTAFQEKIFEGKQVHTPYVDKVLKLLKDPTVQAEVIQYRLKEGLYEAAVD